MTLVENGYCGPIGNSIQQRFDDAYKRFTAFCKSNKISCSQPPFTEKMVLEPCFPAQISKYTCDVFGNKENAPLCLHVDVHLSLDLCRSIFLINALARCWKKMVKFYSQPKHTTTGVSQNGWPSNFCKLPKISKMIASLQCLFAWPLLLIFPGEWINHRISTWMGVKSSCGWAADLGAH